NNQTFSHVVPKKSPDPKVPNTVNYVSDTNRKVVGKGADLSFSRLQDRANLSLGQKFVRACRNALLTLLGKSKLPDLRGALFQYSQSINIGLFSKPITYHATLCFRSDQQGIREAAVAVQREIARHNDKTDRDFGKSFIMNLYNQSDNKVPAILVSGDSYCILNTNTDPSAQWLKDFHGTLDK